MDGGTSLSRKEPKVLLQAYRTGDAPSRPGLLLSTCIGMSQRTCPWTGSGRLAGLARLAPGPEIVDRSLAPRV